MTLLAAALTLPVFLLEMGGHAIPAIHHWIATTVGPETSWLLQFVLTTLVLAIPGRRFFTEGLPALFRGWHSDTFDASGEMRGVTLAGAGYV